MMGERTVAQEALFYEFSLERHVPVDHLLRSIDRFVDLTAIREHLRPFYSEMGRPSIDPELMIRMLIVGYCFGIGRNGGCAARSISTWPIAGSAAWVSTVTCPTTRPSPRTATAVSATATCFVRCSKRRSGGASPRGWSVARASPSTPA